MIKTSLIKIKTPLNKMKVTYVNLFIFEIKIYEYILFFFKQIGPKPNNIFITSQTDGGSEFWK